MRSLPHFAQPCCDSTCLAQSPGSPATFLPRISRCHIRPFLSSSHRGPSCHLSGPHRWGSRKIPNPSPQSWEPACARWWLIRDTSYVWDLLVFQEAGSARPLPQEQLRSLFQAPLPIPVTSDKERTCRSSLGHGSFAQWSRGISSGHRGHCGWKGCGKGTQHLPTGCLLCT